MGHLQIRGLSGLALVTALSAVAVSGTALAEPAQVRVDPVTADQLTGSSNSAATTSTAPASPGTSATPSAPAAAPAVTAAPAASSTPSTAAATPPATPSTPATVTAPPPASPPTVAATSTAAPEKAAEGAEQKPAPTANPTASTSPATTGALPTPAVAATTTPDKVPSTEAAAPTTNPATTNPAATTAPSATPATTTATAAPAAPVATPEPAKTTPAVPAAEAEAAAAPPPTATDPIVAGITKRLADKTATANTNADDVAALVAFYGARAEPLWIKNAAYTDNAKKLADELKKAEDWGLIAAAYPVPDIASGATPEQLATAETGLALSALHYARDARGGRVNPRAVSNIWDVGGEAKDPASVLADLSTSSTPDQVLRDLHPKHPDFEALRQALLKARGLAEVAPPPVDEALLVKLPENKGAKSLKVGDEDDDVVLLRKRLKMAAADASAERIYDQELADAVKGYQSLNGVKANGRLTRRTRQVLNREGEPEKPADKSGTIDNLIVNMERWRWLPADLGNFYVWSNTPEYMARVMKDGKPVFEERVIVGLPDWPTPMLTDKMESIVFNPSWGMPDGIKVKELLPRLKSAGGNNFFEQLFGGGSSGGARVLQSYGLKPTLNGRPVDPNSINWNNVDIRRFSFVQPPGGSNPLGKVKFLFPNRHDVYMHDTTQRPLFAQSRRALSHGCIRVQNPDKLAAVILAEDKGWSADKSAREYQSGGDTQLSKPVPVYLTYFTARPNGDGGIRTFRDIYGFDSRVLTAIAGRPVRYTPPDHTGEEVTDDATVVSDAAASDAPPPPAKKQRQAKTKQKQKQQYNGPDDLISNALSGLLFN